MPMSLSDRNLRTSQRAEGNALPQIRRMTFGDLSDALRKGWDDFAAMPSHGVMLCIVYPVIGFVLARLVLGYSVLPLLFPLAAGFALLGPFAAIGLYELSRRREQGQTPSVSDALKVLHAPSMGAMLGLGGLLTILFLIWVATAEGIYVATFGYQAAASIPDFLWRVVATSEGHRLIVAGCGAGLLFALVAFCSTVVAFPLMLDRNASIADGMLTSLRVVIASPIVMLAWAMIIVGLLLAGTLPAFVGLVVVIPVLGHASWHIYRKAVA